MKLSTIGILLILSGGIALAYQGITYTTREKVIDFGPLKASVNEEHTIPLPPVVGAIAIVGGIILLLRAKSA
jgi:hypothetical protein